MKSYFFIVLVFISTLLFSSCHKNPFKIDVSDIEVFTEIKRFDVELNNIDQDSLTKEIVLLEKKYGSFFQLYNHKIISIGDPGEANYEEYLLAFLNDFTVLELYKETVKQFSDISTIEKDLVKALKHYKYYYPEDTIPRFYSYVSGFNQSIVVGNDFIGIGLDKYLGKDCKLYGAMKVPNYLRYRMTEERIVIDIMSAIATSKFEFNDSIDNLLSQMIYQGKLMYFMKAMMPHLGDSALIGYTSEQHAWCMRFEKDMWTFLIEEKQLFSTELMTIKKYIDESPFTKTFSSDSPGRTGIWIGWQIIKSYKKEHPELTLQELMQQNNYQNILNKSKYNP